MKKLLAGIALVTIFSAQAFAFDVSLGLKSGFTVNESGWGNSWNNGLYLEVGLIKSLAFVVDGNMSFTSVYYIQNNDTLKRNIFVSDGDINLLTKFRYGNSLRLVAAVGPSMQVALTPNPESEAFNTRRNLNFGGTALVGTEFDLGRGYFFTNFSYSGYLSLAAKRDGNDLIITNDGYSDNFKAHFGYAITFKKGDYATTTKDKKARNTKNRPSGIMSE